jgi:PadR family transcriptional regulator PadR
LVDYKKDIRKKLTKNLLDLIVLQLIDARPMCGYEILSTIHKTHGVFLGASTMYPRLKRLEKKKLVKSEWDIQTYRPKKIYRITQDGHTVMEYFVNSLSQICKNLDNTNKNIKNQMEMGIVTE